MTLESISELKHLASNWRGSYFSTDIPIHYSTENLMKNNVQVNEHFSVASTIMKLAFVSGALLSCMYGVLMVFASAFKVLG